MQGPVLNLKEKMSKQDALVHCIACREQLGRESATGNVPLGLTCPVEHMDYSFLACKGFGRLTSTSAEESATKAVAIIGLLFERSIRHDTAMGRNRGSFSQLT